ncbi:LysR substrate-binding domain-containing protein [Ideonella sp.]|jgi:DNA-binding transcriptional LysR family regulator|uniref:LysR substrate-binding domain-containing protein n=1 Tax=Ideonella sp. TaxID=1929293 RepID=UPI0037C1B140
MADPALRLPSLDALRAFEAAARLGQYERAADELAVTASAVAKRVGTLEDLLGGPLFQRATKPLALTAEGKEYLARIAPLLAQLAALPQHRRTHQRRQRLRLTAPPTFARQIIVPALPQLHQACPQIELELVLSVPFMDAAAPEADLHVRLTPLAQAGPALLMVDHLLPLAAPSLLAHTQPRTLADLARLPLLRTPVDPWAPWAAAAGLDLPEPDEGPRLVDLGLVLEAAIHGQGVALARPSLALGALRAGLLAPVLGAGATPTAPAATAYTLHLPDNGSTDTAEGVVALALALKQAAEDAAALGLALVSGGG